MLDLLLTLRALMRRSHRRARRRAALAGSLVATVALVHVPLAAGAQSGSPPDAGPPVPTSPTSTAPATPPPREGFLARLARGLDQVNVVATSARMSKAVTIDVEQRGIAPLPYNGAMLGVSTVDLRDGAGVRLHVYLHNTGDQTLTIPVPTTAMFALLDGRGRSLNIIGAMYDETADGHKAPDVANGTLTLPALERVSFVLLYGPAAPDASELMLRVSGAGVIRGLPAHADGGAQAMQQQSMQQMPPANAMPNGQPPMPQPATSSGSGSPP